MGPDKPIKKMTIAELKAMVEEDIKKIEEDIRNRKITNYYKGQAYADKLKYFLKDEYFKSGSLYKKFRDITDNLKGTYQRIQELDQKIIDAKRLKKLKGQVSFFDAYTLTEEEMENVLKDPEAAIKSFELEKDSLRKKSPNFMLGYLTNHGAFLKSLYKEEK